jgi:hypothetical protein
LHRSVSDTRRSVATRPCESESCESESTVSPPCPSGQIAPQESTLPSLVSPERLTKVWLARRRAPRALWRRLAV